MEFPVMLRQQRLDLLLAVCLVHAALLWWLSQGRRARPVTKQLVLPHVAGRFVSELPSAKPARSAPPPPVKRPPPKAQPQPVAKQPLKPVAKPLAESAVRTPSNVASPRAAEPAAPVAAAAQSHAVAQEVPGPVHLPLSRASGLSNPLPVYPEVSRRLGEEGVVQLSVMIQADGRVSDVSVQKSSGFPRLDAAALAAVRRWHYLPARRNNEAIAWRHTQPVAFSLND